MSIKVNFYGLLKHSVILINYLNIIQVFILKSFPLLAFRLNNFILYCRNTKQRFLVKQTFFDTLKTLKVFTCKFFLEFYFIISI